MALSNAAEEASLVSLKSVSTNVFAGLPRLILPSGGSHMTVRWAGDVLSLNT